MKHYIFSTHRRVSLLVLAGLLAILTGCFIDAIINVNDAGRIWSESGTIDCSSTNPDASSDSAIKPAIARRCGRTKR